MLLQLNFRYCLYFIGDRTASPSGSMTSLSSASRVVGQSSSNQIATSFDMHSDGTVAASKPQQNFIQQPPLPAAAPAPVTVS